MMPEKIQRAYFEGNAKKLYRELSQVPFGERIAIQGMEQGRLTPPNYSMVKSHKILIKFVPDLEV